MRVIGYGTHAFHSKSSSITFIQVMKITIGLNWPIHWRKSCVTFFGDIGTLVRNYFGAFVLCSKLNRLVLLFGKTSHIWLPENVILHLLFDNVHVPLGLLNNEFIRNLVYTIMMKMIIKNLILLHVPVDFGLFSWSERITLSSLDTILANK